MKRTLALANRRAKSTQWNVMDKLEQTSRWDLAYKKKFGNNVLLRYSLSNH